MLTIPIARLVTRPTKDVKTGTSVPDLIMSTLMESGKHLLKSNHVYELRFNRISDTIELVDLGVSHLAKFGHRAWGKKYYDIPLEYGKYTWLTEEEYKQATIHEHPVEVPLKDLRKQ